MSSILTNATALSALQNLATTQKSLQSVQEQISTGLRISKASDNASYWSIGSTMKSDNGALGVVKAALAQGQTMVSTAYTAASGAIDQMNVIKQNLVAAKQPGADLTKIGGVIAQAVSQLKSIVSSSAYNGQNWVDGSTTSIKLVASFNRDSTGATSVGTIDITSKAMIASGVGATAGAGILEGGDGTAAGAGTNFVTMTVDSTTTQAQLDTYVGDADKTLSALQAYAADLGSTQTRLGTQASFIANLSDNLTNGVSALVDADMNEASTRLQALQTQQQLGVQSLSIANQNAQMILKLFG
jgi:flagellin